MPVSHDYADSNLRRRSFQGQNLEGVNFRGADLRGCNFSQAQLKGADLTQAKIGTAPESLVGGLALMAGTAAIAFHLLNQMIFGVLGLTPGDNLYLLKIVLLALSAIVGGLVGLESLLPKTKRSLIALGAIFEGALFGLFGGGLLTNSSPSGGMAFSVLGAILWGLSVYHFYRYGFGLIAITLGLLLCNSLFFLAGVIAVKTFFLNKWIISLGCAVITVLYFWLTLRILGRLLRALQEMAMTSFEGADLSYVRW